MLSACLEKSHATTSPAPSAPVSSTAAPRRRSGTMQNHSARPERERDQCAAGVGQHQRDQHQPHRRVGERVQQRVSGPARSQPHAADHAHRGGEADGVPVVIRRPQAGVGVVRVEAGRGTPWSAARTRTPTTAASTTPPSTAGQRVGAARASATDGAEDAAVGEHPARVLEAVVGLHRPHHRQRREGGEREQEPHRPQPVDAARVRARRTSTAPATTSPAPIVSAISTVVVGAEMQTAAGEERHEAETARDQQRRPPERVRASSRPGPTGRAVRTGPARSARAAGPRSGCRPVLKPLLSWGGEHGHGFGAPCPRAAERRRA